MESDNSNVLIGAILRKTVCTLLKHKAFARNEPDGLRVYPLVAWNTLECVYPRYPDLDQLCLSDEDR